MNPLKGACIIGQSGGPTAVINASALGAIQSALQSEQVTRVLGAANGIEGVLKERLFDMAREDPGELELLKYTPASALGSCRYKMSAPSVDDTDYRRLLEIFRKYDVRYFFYNGGNDSMDTCNKIPNSCSSPVTNAASSESPKPLTMTFTARTTAPASDPPPNLSLPPAWKFTRTSACTTRDASPLWKSWAATPAGWPDPQPWPRMREQVRTWFTFRKFPSAWRNSGRMWTGFTGRTAAACRRLGRRAICRRPLCAESGDRDVFGHTQLGGLGAMLAESVKRQTGAKVRSIELSLLQRCASHVASKTDIDERLWREKPPWKPPFPARRIKW